MSTDPLRERPDSAGTSMIHRRRSPFWMLAVLAVVIQLAPAEASGQTVYGVSTTRRAAVVVTPAPRAVVVAPAPRAVVVAPVPRAVVVATPPVAVALPSGYIAVLPTGYRVVVVGGARYYYVGGIHYRADFYHGRTVYVRVRL